MLKFAVNKIIQKTKKEAAPHGAAFALKLLLSATVLEALSSTLQTKRLGNRSAVGGLHDGS